MPDAINPIGPGGISPIGATPPVPPSPGSEAAGGKSFSQFLAEKLDDVNGLQLQSDQAIQDLANGKVQDLTKVVTAMEKANLAFQMMLQIRNKLVDAYDEMQRIRT